MLPVFENWWPSVLQIGYSLLSLLLIQSLNYLSSSKFKKFKQENLNSFFTVVLMR